MGLYTTLRHAGTSMVDLLARRSIELEYIQRTLERSWFSPTYTGTTPLTSVEDVPANAQNWEEREISLTNLLGATSKTLSYSIHQQQACFKYQDRDPFEGVRAQAVLWSEERKPLAHVAIFTPQIDTDNISTIVEDYFQVKYNHAELTSIEPSERQLAKNISYACTGLAAGIWGIQEFVTDPILIAVTAASLIGGALYSISASILTESQRRHMKTFYEENDKPDPRPILSVLKTHTKYMNERSLGENSKTKEFYAVSFSTPELVTGNQKEFIVLAEGSLVPTLYNRDSRPIN